MKVVTLTSIILPAFAFVGPSGSHVQHRPTLEVAYCSRPPFDNNDNSSFENLRREFSSSEESSAKQAKEIVDRTFRIFQNLNREATTSRSEQERNGELLNKLQQWLDQTIDISEELSRDESSPASSENDQNAVSNEPINHSTNDSFEVQLDVPGVDFSDLDLRLDESLKIVTVVGQRGGRSFSRGVALDPNVDVEQLSASLKNGVLTIRAPKIKPPENKDKRIPVVVEDGL